MRISTYYQFNNLEQNVQLTAERYNTAQEQVSSGKRINRLSDDPAGLAKALNLQTLSASLDAYTSNLSTAKGVLGYTDNALSSINDIATSAYQAALQAANSSTDQTARNTLADQVSSLQARLLDLGNTRGPSGQYIFAGQKNDSQPYNVDSTGIVYQGDNRSVTIPTDVNSSMVVSGSGEPLVSSLYKQLETLKNDLTGGNTASLSGVDVANLQATQKQILASRGQIGAKLQTVDTLTAQFSRRKDDFTASIGDIENVDMSSAILKYQQAQNAYQAALTVSGQGFKLSLMNFMPAA